MSSAQAFNVAAARLRNTSLCYLIEMRFFLWVSQSGPYVQLVRLGLRFVAVRGVAVILALAGILLSVLITLGRSIPHPFRTSLQRELLLIEDVRHIRQLPQRYISSVPQIVDNHPGHMKEDPSVHDRLQATRGPQRLILRLSPILDNCSELGVNEDHHVTSISRKKEISLLPRWTDVLERERSGGKSSEEIPKKPIIMRAASLPQGDFTQIKYCLAKKRHSMPFKRSSRPVPRTDPYQAPYFFPPPGSPAAAQYVREVRSIRNLSGSSATTATCKQAHQDWQDTAPHRISGSTQAPPRTGPHCVNKRKVEDGAGSSMKKARRWSFHIPMYPTFALRSPSKFGARGKIGISDSGIRSANTSPPLPSDTFHSPSHSSSSSSLSASFNHDMDGPGLVTISTTHRESERHPLSNSGTRLRPVSGLSWRSRLGRRSADALFVDRRTQIAFTNDAVN